MRYPPSINLSYNQSFLQIKFYTFYWYSISHTIYLMWHTVYLASFSIISFTFATLSFEITLSSLPEFGAFSKDWRPEPNFFFYPLQNVVRQQSITIYNGCPNKSWTTAFKYKILIGFLIKVYWHFIYHYRSNVQNII